MHWRAARGTGAPPIGGVPLLRRHHAPASVPERALGLDGGDDGWPVHAVMAVDPGGTTGLAACHVQVRPTMKATCLEGMLTRKAVEVRGYWFDQAQEIVRAYDTFAATAELGGIPVERIHLVCESFLADPRRIGAGATNLDPVWIGGALCGLLGWEPIWQTPSEAKGYARNDRLRQWGLWEVGSEHKRDAWRHVAYRLDKLIR